MIRFELTEVVDRPAQEVFDYVTNPEKLPEWQSMVSESRQDSQGPMGVGTRVTNVRNFLGRRIESQAEVTAYESPRRFDVRTVSGPVPFQISHTLEPKEASTVIKVETQGEPGGFFKLAEPLVGRQAERQFKNDFATLKDLLEARAGN
ncbi:MAG: SRPBCC family protein [Actinobacteria bacterium]|nr:SRPBCC family protein [Actinomycetota bacterium]